MPQEVERAQHRVAHRAMAMQHVEYPDPPSGPQTTASPLRATDWGTSLATAALIPVSRPDQSKRPRVKSRISTPARRTWRRSGLNTWANPDRRGGLAARAGMQGETKPAVRNMAPT